MTISRKLNKSISTALITLLVLSTFVGLISFASAGTTSSGSSLSFSGTGSRLWSTAVGAAQGDFAVKLTNTASQGVEAKIATNFLFGTNDLSATSFSSAVYPVATTTDLANKLTMKVYMDSDGNGVSDYYFNLTAPAPTDGVWALWQSSNWIVQNSTIQSGQTLGTSVHGSPNGDAATYEGWNATSTFSEDTVLAVSVILSAAGAANTVYIDSITAGTTTYNLEPVALTLNQASATTMQTTATAPTADIVNVFAANGTFNNNEAVTIFFQGVGPAVGAGTATANGGFSGSFQVPNVAAGTYTVTALGTTSGRTFTGTLVVATPTVTINPSTATAGATVAITGTNFNIGGKFNMTFNGVAWGTANQTIDGTGAISTTAVVPTLPTGTYSVSVTDGLNTKTIDFVIPNPTITLSPTSGPSGKTLAVKGMGFSLNGLVQIYFGGALLWSTQADAYGNLTGATGISVTVPDKVAGAYSVIVVDVTTGLSSNTATFTVNTPAIKVAPLTGPVGSSFVINGTNFKVNSPVNVKFNGVSIANITTNNNPGTTSNPAGAFPNNTLTVPNVVPGTYLIDATDGINSASVSFTVPAASITLSPNAGPATTTFNVIGTGFKVSSPITITFNGTAITGSTSNTTGGFNQVETVPSYPIGAYIVNATDGVTFATATFNIGAAISTLNVTSGVPGTGVAVTGLGFTNSQRVYVYFDDMLVKNVTASSTGGLSTSFVVPDVLAGVHQVTAFDVFTELTTPVVNFTVLEPTLTIPTAEGQTGTVAMIAGTQYKLGATVTIIFNGEAITTVTATAAGALPSNANFTVPSVVPGQYTVEASDGVNSATATFNVFGSGGIDQVIDTLAQYGTFYNFTNNWFMTIDAKLGEFTGNDTVATLLYDIQSKVNLPSELVFTFGGPSSFRPEYIHITNTTVYDEDLGFGWMDTTDLQWRDRGVGNDALRQFVNSRTAATFQVALPDGDYLVTVVQGDATWAHDGMTIFEGNGLVATVDSAINQFPPTTFKVSVDDGLLQLTFAKADGAVDGNWVINGLTIRQALP